MCHCSDTSAVRETRSRSTTIFLYIWKCHIRVFIALRPPIGEAEIWVVRKSHLVSDQVVRTRPSLQKVELGSSGMLDLVGHLVLFGSVEQTLTEIRG